MSRIKTHVSRGDLVEVIAGSQLYDYQYGPDGEVVSKTKRPAEKRRGHVLAVNAEKGQVIVEGLKMIVKHQKKTQQSPEGGRIEREGPIHISNVKLVEKKDEKAPTKGKGKK